jgi:hypothetical protein
MEHAMKKSTILLFSLVATLACSGVNVDTKQLGTDEIDCAKTAFANAIPDVMLACNANGCTTQGLKQAVVTWTEATVDCAVLAINRNVTVTPAAPTPLVLDAGSTDTSRAEPLLAANRLKHSTAAYLQSINKKPVFK